ncbi:hypothetical protein, partial [Arthrobacter sp.]
MTGRSSRRRKFIALAVALPLALSAAGLGSIGAASAETQATAADLPWMNTALTPQERSALLLKALTLDQKLQQLSGARPEILPDLPE